MKIQTATNEFIRRLKLTSRDLPKSHIDQVLKEYSCDLKRGGHKAEWVKEALKNALRGYSKMVENEVDGKCPINRPEAVGKLGRRVKTLIGKSSWFTNKSQSEKQKDTTGSKSKPMKKGEPPEPPETILYVPFTPGSVLKKEIQSLEDTLNTSKFGRVRVLERLGRSVIETIGNKAPWRSEPCSRSQCVPCTTKPGSCRSRNVTYKIVCNTCAKSGQSKIYWGESHRAWADRCQDHVDAVKSRNLAYAIVKHNHIPFGARHLYFIYKFHRSCRTS